MTDTPKPDQTIDLTGLRCPNLVIAIIAALRPMRHPQILQVIANDLTAPSNVSAWARQSGHALLEMYEENGRFIFYLQRAQHVSAASPSFNQQEAL